ncbi:menaquinone biosynthesis protein [Paenibacillus sp. N1-5-1-14]|uniref:menaquinone biosynthetic enzyme MqnA/MqnD family protein n=1 Tax=Paenibacillus radicibacter TaxID=2972488 RepID=UPI002158D847|nr:menaquinone biosynthesis protein [Paenibacillus radicibacter]MCR8642292.1 menaquinone biosynthesis protein [Paenibacillus radicibacter]
MNKREKQIHIGRINYTNVWPIFHSFPQGELRDSVQFIEQVPSSLNRAMKAGEVDMGPISSFAYGENFKNYVLYPDLSVSARDRVNSILLFHRKPLEEIKNGRIALTNASATSVNLLKIILQKFYGGTPTYTTSPPVLEEMMVDHDAALLIGDEAIRSSWVDSGYTVTDLGQEWRKWTGKGMTFAVWAIREDTIEKYPQMVEQLFQAFVHSKQESLAHPLAMVHDAMALVGGTEAYWLHYFGNLCYDFGPEQWDGLQLYYQYAWELGFLPEQVEMKLWS